MTRAGPTSRYQQACTAELDFIRDLIPEATVERVTHKTAGDHTCAYDVILQTETTPAPLPPV